MLDHLSTEEEFSSGAEYVRSIAAQEEIAL
jgi:hypothetical protein